MVICIIPIGYNFICQLIEIIHFDFSNIISFMFIYVVGAFFSIIMLARKDRDYVSFLTFIEYIFVFIVLMYVFSNYQMQEELYKRYLSVLSLFGGYSILINILLTVHDKREEDKSYFYLKTIELFQQKEYEKDKKKLAKKLQRIGIATGYNRIYTDGKRLEKDDSIFLKLKIRYINSKDYWEAKRFNAQRTFKKSSLIHRFITFIIFKNSENYENFFVHFDK